MMAREPAAWIRHLHEGKSGPVLVQLSPDYFVEFPVEVFVERGPGYVSAEMLGLSDELSSDLTTWQRWFDEHTDVGREPLELGPESDWTEWSRQGDVLRERLSDELGPGFDVR